MCAVKDESRTSAIATTSYILAISSTTMNARLIFLLASFAGKASAFTVQGGVTYNLHRRALVAPLGMTQEDNAVDTSRLHTGKVKFFTKNRGYGFIVPADGGEDVFAHQENIQMDGYRYLVPKDTVHYRLKINEKNGKTYATEIFKAGSIEEIAAVSHELEDAVLEATLMEADAIGVALEADQIAESLDAQKHDGSTMTIQSAQEIAAVESKAKTVEEEVEDIAAHVLPVMAVEEIARKLSEDQKKAEANEKAKVAANIDKTHPDPFHHLKSMFGM